MVVVDTSVVVAVLNRRDSEHERVMAWLDQVDEDLVTSPLTVAEMDYLVGDHPAAAKGLRRDLSTGVYGVVWWAGAMEAVVQVAERYADLPLGLADASLVALAREVGTARIATLDERHFRALRPLTGEDAFVLLPADA